MMMLKQRYNTRLAYPMLIKFIQESLAKVLRSVKLAILGPLAKIAKLLVAKNNDSKVL